jgi:hypothetical protein
MARDELEMLEVVKVDEVEDDADNGPDIEKSPNELGGAIGVIRVDARLR